MKTQKPLESRNYRSISKLQEIPERAIKSNLSEDPGMRIWNADTQKFQAAKLVPCWLSKVSETAFELSGRQFQFRPGQVQHFTWEDGTVQTVQSIQKTPI